MRISIAMATYNGSRFLPTQLGSLLKQIRLPDELIVCDDRSTDPTVDILRDFKKHAPFSVQLFFNKNNLGHSKNFEKSISLCTGEAIALADQDDVWYPEKLLRLEKVLSSSHAVGLAFSDSDLIDEAGDRVNQTVWNRLGFDLSKQSQMKHDAFGLLSHGPCITGMSMMFRSDFCSKILPIPEEWHHDAWIALLVSLLAKIEPVGDRLNAYRVHPNQETYTPLIGRTRRASRSIRASRYLEGAIRYEQAKMRVLSWKGEEPPENLMSRLDGKIGFLKDRSKTYASMFWWPIVLRQWRAGRYRQYGSGLRGALGDLFLLGNPTKNEN